MKKLFLLVVTALFALNISSCLKSDNTTNTFAAGMELYQLGKMQATIDMDPIVIAMKLNTLIVTAEQQGEDYNTVEVVLVEGKEKDDDNEAVEEVKVKVIEKLFGTNKVTRSGTKWTIDYTVNEIIDKEIGYRSGSVVIETNGHTLEEIGDAGSMWEISFTGGSYDFNYGGRFVNAFDHYYIEPGSAGPYSWKASGVSRAYYGDNSAGAASVSFTYEVVCAGTFFYKDILSAAFYVSGTSVGRGYHGNNMTYTPTSIKFKPACNLYTVFGGSEKVTIDRNEIPVENYPDNTVKYNWFDNTASGSCESRVEMSYNGYTS